LSRLGSVGSGRFIGGSLECHGVVRIPAVIYVAPQHKCKGDICLIAKFADNAP
jgi:hypothetical protein